MLVQSSACRSQQSPTDTGKYCPSMRSTAVKNDLGQDPIEWYPNSSHASILSQPCGSAQFRGAFATSAPIIATAGGTSCDWTTILGAARPCSATSASSWRQR